MTTCFHSFDNSMRAHICHEVNIIVLARRIGRKYVIVNELFFVLFFLIFSANFSKKLPHSITSVLQSKICGSVQRYISKSSCKRLVFSGCWHWEVLYPNKNRFFNFCHGKKKSDIRILSDSLPLAHFTSPPFLPKQLKILQKVTKLICRRSII